MTAVRTLIVDDDFTVASVHSAYTERVPGFCVVGTAHSGGQALEMFDRVQPDLVVLDVYLPDMSGLEVLQELRGRGAAVDAIVVTAARDAESLRSAMAGGALRYIIKPFNFERFKDTLQSYYGFVNRRSVLEAALDQEDVDRLYAAMGVVPDQRLPKNLNRPTLELVTKCLQEQPERVSALDVARWIGLSRGTARRYLEFLESSGRVVMELRYGSAGRPEHRYKWAAGSSQSVPPGDHLSSERGAQSQSCNSRARPSSESA